MTFSLCDYFIEIFDSETGLPPDAELFALTQPSFDLESNGTSRLVKDAMLIIETDDSEKVGTYNLIVRVKDTKSLGFEKKTELKVKVLPCTNVA